jgi:hypothetical protein
MKFNYLAEGVSVILLIAHVPIVPQQFDLPLFHTFYTAIVVSYRLLSSATIRLNC